jgi:divalent metal cation (Fe/Co/Zn/Cd) transporter
LNFVYPRWEIDTGAPITWIPLIAVSALIFAAWWWRTGRGRPALIALLFYRGLGIVAFDAAGALAAAVMMAAASLMLMAQARALITGRSLPEQDLERLRGAVLETPGVDALNHLAAIHSGASQVLVDLDLDLAEGLDTTRIEALLDDVEARVRRAVPETTRVRVELNSPPDPDSRNVGSAPR